MPDLTSMLRSNWERGRLRTATVTAVSTTGRVDLSWQGSFVPNVPYLGWYSPTAGDIVQVMVENGSLLCLGTLSAGGAGGLGPNLLPNPSFELGTVGGAPSSWTAFWSTTGGKQTMVNTTAHSGGSAAQFDVDSAPVGNFTFLSVDAVSVDPGITYRVGGWFKANATDPTHLTCTTRIYTGVDVAGAQPFGGGTFFSLASTTTAGPSWVEVAGTYTIPVGHVYARVMLLATTTAGFTVSKVYADDATLQRQT